MAVSRLRAVPPRLIMKTLNRNSGPSESRGGGSLQAPREREVESAADFRSSDLSGTGEAIFTADLQGNFLACNPAFTQLFGFRPKELAGRKFAGLFSHQEKSNKQDAAELEKTVLDSAIDAG